MDAGDNGVILLPRTYKRAQVKRKTTKFLRNLFKRLPRWVTKRYKKIYITAISCRPGHGDLIASDSKEFPARAGGDWGGFFCCLWVRTLLPDVFFGYSLQVLGIYLADANEPREGWCCWSSCEMNFASVELSIYAVLFLRRVTQTAS